MKKWIKLLVILFLFTACKKDTPSVESSTISSQEKESITEVEITDTDNPDVSSLIVGTHTGKGTYEFDDGTTPDKMVTTIEIVRKDNSTVIVSSPEKIFPDFEVVELVEQFSTVAGKPDEGSGAMMFSKIEKEVKILIKQFAAERTVLRFGN